MKFFLSFSSRKSGFTLMEILFVMLLIALVVSFAVPAFRTVRYDMKNSQAKTALKKLAEARRSYYQATRGQNVTGSFSGISVTASWAGTCPNRGADGRPASAVSGTPSVQELFSCGYLNWQDFAGLPYTFSVCGGSTTCSVSGQSNLTVMASPSTADAGSKYYNASPAYRMWVDFDMKAEDNLR